MSGRSDSGCNSEPAPRIPPEVIADLQDQCDLLGLVQAVTGTLRSAGKEFRGWCPLCKRQRSLTVFEKNDRWRWYCWGCAEGHGPIDWLTKVAGLTFLEAVEKLGGDVDELRRVGVSPAVKAEAERRQRERDEKAAANSRKRRLAAWDLWGGRAPVDGTPAAVYFAARGIAGPYPATLGYHSHIWTVRSVTSDDGSVREERVAFPGVLGCVVSGERRFLAVHRVFLTVEPDGHVVKCKGLEAGSTKRALGDLCDGAVRLTRRPKAGGTLALTEGIETGLAVAQALRRAGRLAENGGDAAVWSALYAEQLKRVGFGPDPFWRPARIIVMADNDPKSKTGETKAVEACRRFQSEFGIPSAWSMPNRPGWDWNDPLIKTTEVR